MKQNKIKKIILFSLVLITGLSCAKKKKDNTPLVLGLVLLSQSQQAKAEVFPTCKLTSRFSGTGTATVLNVPWEKLEGRGEKLEGRGERIEGRS